MAETTGRRAAGWTFTRRMRDIAYYVWTGTDYHAQKTGRYTSDELRAW